MADWGFYGRDKHLADLHQLVDAQRWFFCRIQGRRRIGKTALLKRLASVDSSLLARLIYMQVPDSAEQDVVATFQTALQNSDQQLAKDLAHSVSDFASMAAAIATLNRANFVVVLDEFQYFVRSGLWAFNSFLQAQVDDLRGTTQGGLFVLGSIQSEMEALLNSKSAPLYGRLTSQRMVEHWDFEDLLAVFSSNGLDDPNQWLTLWSFFEGVPKFYQDSHEQGLFNVEAGAFREELIKRMFLMSSAPLSEEAETWFMREIRGRGVSVLNYLAKNPGANYGELTSGLAGNNEKERSTMSGYLKALVEGYRLVEKKSPVFSDANNRSARYYIADNFLQGWLAVAKPAREYLKLQPIERALQHALPRLYTHEGHAFEKLIRQLHVECSQKGTGDFVLTDINLGFWNRPRDTTRSIEIDLVALNSEAKTVRFGTCKRSPTAHDTASLGEFERHVAAFLSTREGRRVLGWNIQKVCFSPKFDQEQRTQLKARGFESRDLSDYRDYLNPSK